MSVFFHAQGIKTVHVVVECPPTSYQNQIKIIFQEISSKMQCKRYKYSKRGYISQFEGQILSDSTLCWLDNPIRKSRQIK